MSEKPIISRVVVLYGSGCETYQVGSDRINCIKDLSVEFESELHNIYEVYKCGKLFCRIVNCPVVVEFYQSKEATNEGSC